ncbi:MAG: aminopeptidase P family protein [Deltaproteobacteria bacterium]|nr:aminopeptidase P family protein [Deltaproteobacteria bacterium]MBW2048007.1 aminopeptidase P family protein [Deltaproteobacteria bacterium]MBW2111378.1 aminopeptidase P family protein [Deltaproteobacteria bacterium]MBW2353963.1 aminopeptidase P family protein [Deltaproteobacteria bacterium]HDZ90727.1 aminopeptidase P family protein [Deltaproteobacteria bacterium]
MNPLLTEEEIRGRLSRFQIRLTKMGLDGALIAQKTDLYYLSGTDQDAHLWVPASGPPLLMVRRSVERAREDALVEEVVPVKSLSQIPEYIHGHSGKDKGLMGLEMDVLPVGRYLKYRDLFPGVKMVDISKEIRKTRMVKSAYEISCVEEAGLMADRAYEKIPAFLMQGETEIDLTYRVEGFYRSQGHPGVIPTRGFNYEALYGQISSGWRSAAPSNSAGPTGGRGLGPFFSQGASMERIGPNQPILVDYAANFNGYISDLTRIFSIGRIDQGMRRAHETALAIQGAVARQGKPGVRAESLYDLAMSMAQEAGLESRFMGYPDPVPFIGHGVGLELDEWPVIGRGSGTLLREGMVIALEPKFIFPDRGVVGIENTFVVEKDGMKKLNHFPEEIFEVRQA